MKRNGELEARDRIMLKDLREFGFYNVQINKEIYGVLSKDKKTICMTTDPVIMTERKHGMKVLTKDKGKSVRTSNFLNFDTLVTADMRDLIVQFCQDHITKEVWNRVNETIKENLERHDIPMPPDMIKDVYSAVRKGFISDISCLYSIPVVLNRKYIFSKKRTSKMDQVFHNQFFAAINLATITKAKNPQEEYDDVFTVTVPIFKRVSSHVIDENIRTANDEVVICVGEIQEKYVTADIDFILETNPVYLENEIFDDDTDIEASIFNVFQYTNQYYGITFEQYENKLRKLVLPIPHKDLHMIQSHELYLLNNSAEFGPSRYIERYATITSVIKCALHLSPFVDDTRIMSAPAYQSQLVDMVSYNKTLLDEYTSLEKKEGKREKNKIVVAHPERMMK